MLLAALVVFQNPKLSASFESYQAHIAAASAALKDGDSCRAQSWLNKAPKPHRGWEWDYLNKECDLSAATAEVGSKSLTKIQCSPDGKTLAVASADGSVTLLNAADLSIKSTLKGHTNSVFGTNFSSDGSQLITTSRDFSIRLWDVAASKEMGKLGDHPTTPYDAKLTPDGTKAVSVGWRLHPETKGPVGLIRVWDVATKTLLKSIDYTTHPISSVTFSTDSKKAYIGCWEYQTAVFNMAKMEVEREIAPPEDAGYKAIDGVELDPTDTLLLTATKDKSAKIFYLGNGALRGVLAHRGMVTSARWAAEGKYVVTSSQDGTVRVFDPTTQTQIAQLLGHGAAVNCVAVSPDGRAAYSSDINGTVKKWDIANPSSYSLSSQVDGAWSCVFSPDGSSIAAGTNARTIQVRDSRTMSLVAESPKFGSLVVDVAWSPDGKKIAAGANDGTVRAFAYPSMQPLWEAKGKGQMRAVDWSSDGRFVASGGSTSGLVHVIDAANGAAVFEHKLKPGTLTVAFSPDTKRLAAASATELLMLDLATKKVVAQTDKLASDSYDMAFSPDGKTIAVGESAGQVEAFSSSGLKKMWSQKTGGSQWGVHFSPDGSRLATFGYDFTLHLWEPRTGAHVFALYDLEEQGFDARFSPDGDRLAFMGGGKTWVISRRR